MKLLSQHFQLTLFNLLRKRIMTSFHKIIVIVGFISLFHSAFSAAQHRSYLRITSQEFTTLPLDIIIQVVASLFAVMWGVLNVAGKLREIPAANELNMIKWETQRNIPSFYIFNHRGRALAYNFVPTPSKGDLENLE